MLVSQLGGVQWPRVQHCLWACPLRLQPLPSDLTELASKLLRSWTRDAPPGLLLSSVAGTSLHVDGPASQCYSFTGQAATPSKVNLNMEMRCGAGSGLIVSVILLLCWVFNTAAARMANSQTRPSFERVGAFQAQVLHILARNMCNTPRRRSSLVLAVVVRKRRHGQKHVLCTDL
eukprot:365340-Chlamydomonas_euryale.AAC.6